MLRNIIDVDSHEFMPSHFYPDLFGEVGHRVMELYDRRNTGKGEWRENDLTRPDIVGDAAPIDPTTIWRLKGPGAPGAIDMRRRNEVLDAMGVDCQLVFPTFGFIGLLLAQLSDAHFDKLFHAERCDHRRIGLDAIAAHNDWALGMTDLSDRQHHVAIVTTFDLDAMLREAERLLSGGARALWIPATTPPAGTSPANEALDPFWAMAVQHDVPVILHLNTDPFLPAEWWDAPQFARQCDSILPRNVYFMTTFAFAVENFLASMIIGGVFDRHPKLRLGIIECGAQWLGPLCERMEQVWDYFAQTRQMPKRPTEYVTEHVRVTPFFFEPIDSHLERYPHLVDVYCFSSDYPHSEGGVDAVEQFHARLKGFGDDAIDKFFRRNAQLIMPA